MTSSRGREVCWYIDWIEVVVASRMELGRLVFTQQADAIMQDTWERHPDGRGYWRLVLGLARGNLLKAHAADALTES